MASAAEEAPARAGSSDGFYPDAGATPANRSAQGVTLGGAEAPARAPQPVSVLQTWVAVDPQSVRLANEIRGIAASGSTVLIRGESGVGKNLLASILHYLGPQPDQFLAKFDCAGLPAELLETELFGLERGSFPGATHGKPGRLEGAGTIVLDEVAALPMPIQAKLLRVIDEKRFERLGAARSIPVQARIITLTTVDLERAVARRTFREDLYYRLNVLPMLVPPLRERTLDIAPLAAYFLAQLAAIHRKPRLSFAPATLMALESYSYPGNVQELRTLVERAVISATLPEILPQDLPAHVRDAAAMTGKMSLEEMEHAYIAEVLEYTRGKKTMAAQILGISRKTLLEKRKRYGLQ